MGGTAILVYRQGGRRDSGPADVAVVLGASVWTDRPSPVFRERIRHGVDLVKEGTVRRVLFTGGSGSPGELPEAVVAFRYAVDLGLPEGSILLETASHTTLQNLIFATQIMASQGLHTCLLVSDPDHMLRALRMARDLGMEAGPSPTPSSVYRSFTKRLPFLLRESVFYWNYRGQRLWRGISPGAETEDVR